MTTAPNVKVTTFASAPYTVPKLLFIKCENLYPYCDPALSSDVPLPDALKCNVTGTYFEKSIDSVMELSDLVVVENPIAEALPDPTIENFRKYAMKLNARSSWCCSSSPDMSLWDNFIEKCIQEVATKGWSTVQVGSLFAALQDRASDSRLKLFLGTQSKEFLEFAMSELVGQVEKK